MADLLQKYRLLRGLCTGERAFTGPFFVTLDVTRRCNLRCLGCRFHSTETDGQILGDQSVKDLRFDWAEKLFSELKELNTRTLFLMGEGEPFLHPRIFDIIRLAKKFGLRTTVTTNGTLVDDVMAERIIDAGLDEMHISLLGKFPRRLCQTIPRHESGKFPSCHQWNPALIVPQSTKAYPNTKYRTDESRKPFQLPGYRRDGSSCQRGWLRCNCIHAFQNQSGENEPLCSIQGRTDQSVQSHDNAERAAKGGLSREIK